MRSYARAVSLLIGLCSAVFAGLGLYAEESGQLQTLFQQLQSPERADRAAEQLLKLGNADPEARKYLAGHLPAIIEKGPSDRQPWNSAVQLAGELKITGAVPSLVKWIGLPSSGTLTLSGWERLENNSAAKALVKVGDPAIPAVVNALKRGDLKTRWDAVLVLDNIGSAAAKRALREHLKRETDPGLRDFIERAVALK